MTFLIFLLKGVAIFLQIYFYILIAYILLSWITELRNSKFYYYIKLLADPYMRIFRGLLVFGMMDFTPIIGFLLYQYGLDQLNKMINMLAG